VTDNRTTITRFWDTLYARDWGGLAGFFTDDATYTDVCSPADDIAVGPDQILRRLRLGIEPISGYDHNLKLMVVDGDVVVTEHSETWRWRDGEEVTLPFLTVQELREGRITRWYDYWDLGTLMNAAPAWWIEHVMVGWADKPSS